MPSVIPCSLSPLIFRIHLFRTGGVPSYRNSSTRRFPQSPPRNLCFLVSLAVFSVVFAAMDRAFCQALIYLELAQSEILAAPADTFHLILHCPAKDSLCRSLFGDSLSLPNPRPRAFARIVGLHGLPPCPHPLEGIR